jgi:transcriptional regulator with XRE-family HTH domain
MAKEGLDSHPPYKPAVILKELRTQIGMTQPRLGELTGFSRDDIANFERAGTGAGSFITMNDALKCYEALATEDKSGDALSAALSAANFLVGNAKHECEQARKHLEAARKYLESARSNAKKCKAAEKRIKALKRKSFPRHKADDRFLIEPFPTKVVTPAPGEPGSRFNPLIGR